MQNYYYIDFKDLDIYSNEGETSLSELDKANFLIGNNYPTYHLAQKAIKDIMEKNDIQSEDIEMLQRENKAMAQALSKLNYTDTQISDIANGTI